MFASCTKTEESAPTRADELRNGKWKMIAGTHRLDPAIGADQLINYYEALPGCRKDDYLVFGAVQDGQQFSGEKCDLSDPDAVDFKWYLENNGNKINFYNAFQTFLGQEAVSANFLSYGPSEFTIRYMNFAKNQFDSLRNDTITYTYTFQKH